MWVGRKGSAGWLCARQVPQLVRTTSGSEQEAVGGHPRSHWKFGKHCLTEKEEGWKGTVAICQWRGYGKHLLFHTPPPAPRSSKPKREWLPREKPLLRRLLRFWFTCYLY